MKTKIGILSAPNQDAIYLEYRGVPVQAPEGSQWAQASLDHFHAGMQKLKQNQEALIGTSVLAEGFARKGVFLILNDGMMPSNMYAAHGAIGATGEEGVPPLNFSPFLDQVPQHIRKQVEELKLVPAIQLNNQTYSRHPENAAFLLGHELAEHYNLPPDKMAEYTLLKMLTQSEPATTKYSMHSANHTFGMGVQLDYLNGQMQQKQDNTLPLFTQRRTAIRSSAANSVFLPREMLADATGLFFSGDKPIFEGNELMSKQAFPVFSPIAKQYVETVLLLDAAHRVSGLVTPGDKRNYENLQQRLFSPTGGLPQEDFEHIRGIYADLQEGNGIKQEALEKAAESIQTQIASYKGELKKLTAEIKGQSPA